MAAPALAALLGASGPARIDLNLGPGDAPYVRGFTPEYEIDEKVATHWTSYHASVELPLTLRGPIRLAYRYARVLPETAQVEVRLAGRPIDHFTCRGGRFEERASSAGALPATPARLEFEVDSHDRRNLGLKLDWVRFEVGEGGWLALSGAARFRPALVVALVLLMLRCAGLSLRTAAWLASPAALAASLTLLWRPWLMHQLCTGVPETLALVGLPAILVARALTERGRIEPRSLRNVACLGLAAFLMRATVLNHPAFYYPDLRTHARYARGLREMGGEALLRPADLVKGFGIWKTESGEGEKVFPYPPSFHVPFALLGRGLDETVTAMKLWAVALSVVPLVLLWALARRLEASVLGVVLMLFIPTYTSRLSFAFLPALFGHAAEAAFLYWLAGHLAATGQSRRALLQGALFASACQLAYVSGVINVSILLGILGLVTAILPPASLRRAAGIVGMGLFSSLLSFALYYRDFLPMAFDVLPGVAGGAATASRYPAQPFLAVVAARTHDFFGGVLPALALAGLVILLARGRGRGLLLAWGASYFVMLLGRAKLPDLFLHGHETLFVTPLVCLAAGEALLSLWRLGRIGRVAAASGLLFLAYQGLALQWQALAAQLQNAL